MSYPREARLRPGDERWAALASGSAALSAHAFWRARAMRAVWRYRRGLRTLMPIFSTQK